MALTLLISMHKLRWRNDESRIRIRWGAVSLDAGWATAREVL